MLGIDISTMNNEITEQEAVEVLSNLDENLGELLTQ